MLLHAGWQSVRRSAGKLYGKDGNSTWEQCGLAQVPVLRLLQVPSWVQRAKMQKTRFCVSMTPSQNSGPLEVSTA